MIENSVNYHAGLLSNTRLQQLHRPLLTLLAAVALVLVFSVFSAYRGAPLDDGLIVESTVGQLTIWMADQTANDPEDIVSPLAQYAVDLALELKTETLDASVLLSSMRNGLVVWMGTTLALLIIGLGSILFNPKRTRRTFFVALLMLDILLFIIPTLPESDALSTILLAILIILIVLLLLPGRLSRVLGFFVALSVLMIVWESGKSFAQSIDYKITLPQSGWEYASYPTLDETLAALESGEIDFVIADRKDLRDLMHEYPEEDNSEEMPYANLRYLGNLDRTEGFSYLPIIPAFPGRLTVAVRADEAGTTTAIRDIIGRNVGTVAGDFADEKLLQLPRQLVLLDLKILNDLNLPHLQMISEAFLQPARRNGGFLLIRILADAGVYTFSEAIFGFTFGAIFGFILGTIFAHSRLMERGLLPYVVASQTVPILAIAPMVVIWLGASPMSVAVIAAYLTFFPVTINTLRGLQSPQPAAVELMRSYAANQWTIMWKLRFPAALPYIFTALKVSATASVVGAIIGELPSGIGEGLGRAILDFSSDYSLISTPKLWAAIIMAASVGILFFVSVTILERFVLRGYIRKID